MSGLELPAFVAGVAGLFSSSVDAFSYFKAAQNADKDVDTVLLKLDVEKTRLLLWANEIGMFSQHPRLLDEAVVDLISRILKKVITKLTSSEQLRASYGVTNLETPRVKAVDYLSSNGFEIFRRSSHRFWTRYASKLRPQRATGEGSVITKTKWAIYEKEKFQALVNDVKDFVDNLYEFIPVDKETQMHVFKADIESILDLSHLKLVEAATEDSYPAYSEIAGSVVEASEQGTVDRRTIEEYIRDVENLNQETTSSHVQHLDVSSDLNPLFEEIRFCTAHIVLTSLCQNVYPPYLCALSQLGERTGAWNPNNPSLNWSVTHGKEHEYALWDLVRDVTNARAEIKCAFEDHRSDLMGQFVTNDHLDDDRRQAIQAFLPLVTISIYCSPCVRHLHTALDISHRLTSKYVRVKIRPDDRTWSSCCQNTDRTAGLMSILDYVSQSEANEALSWTGILSYLDRKWVGRRLNISEYEQMYKYQETQETRVIIISETDALQPLVPKDSGRMPKAGEIWTMDQDYSSHPHETISNWIFRHRFVEKSRPVGVLNAAYPEQNLSSVSYAKVTNLHGSKRASSPESTENKRQKLSETSEAKDSGEDITTTSVSSSQMSTK